MKLIHTKSALFAFLLALPMLVLIPSVAFDFDPVEAFLKSFLTDNGETLNLLGYTLMFLGLFALPVGLIVALRPFFMKENGVRNMYVVNILVAVLILALMVPTWGALATEIYRCDILRVPNCD